MWFVLLAIAALTMFCLCVNCAAAAVPLLLFRRLPSTVLVFPLAMLPLLMYFTAAPLVRSYLQERIRDAAERRLHQKQTRSLTLAGFSFTALAVLVRLYSGALPPLEGCAVSLALSLFFFVSSYMLLRFRMKEWSDYFSDAMLDSGLWCLFITVAFFYLSVIRSGYAVALIAILMVGFIAWVAVHLRFYVRYARKLDTGRKGGVHHADSSLVR
jgi:hypothetical protein